MLPYQSLTNVAAGQGLKLLDGVTVLDLTTSIAGPYAAMLLGDLGARVIKIERPRNGDDSRAWGPPFLQGESLWFMSVNRNKESIVLDYSTDAGRAVLTDMLRKADVVITNLMERVLRKLKLDPASLKSVNPGIVHVSITGFGLTGERKNLPCYDLIAEGYSGVMDLTGEADSPPQKVGTPAADLIPGVDAALAAVAALLDRTRTGQGHSIDVAMVDSMVRFMSPRILPYLGSGEVPQRTGARDSVLAVYQVFDTRDNPITLGIGNDAIWKRFWEAAGKPEMGMDERFKSNADRRAARQEIVGEIQELLRAKGRDHWLAVFAAANVPAGPVNTIEDLVNDKALQERGLFYRADTQHREIPQVGFAVAIDGVSNTYRSEPPVLGQHTLQVLGDWLGYDEARIRILRDAGTVG